jgi:hypothetical protein
MYEYRQVLLRLRLGGTDREVARAQRIGRAKVAQIRQLAGAQGWLDPSGPMPEDAQLCALFKVARAAAQNVSSVEPFRDDILAWHAQGIQASTIRRALARIHGFDGSCTASIAFCARLHPRGRRRRSCSTSRWAIAPRSTSAKAPDHRSGQR